MNPVKVEHHIKHLQDLHYSVDLQIKQAFNNYSSDVQIQQLKKKKLQLKDQIDYYKKQLNESSSNN